MAQYNGNDIYCDLIVPRKVDIKLIKETPLVLAYHHTRPNWPVHIVVTPKQHIPSLLELPDYPEVAKELLNVITEVAASVNAAEGKCKIVTNLGEYQDSKHLHFHLISGASFNGE